MTAADHGQTTSAREQVAALAAAGLSLDRGRAGTLLTARTPEGGTPVSIEGPYYVATAGAGLERSDIREDQPGIPLLLRIGVRDAASGTPVPGAVVDVWHCDAHGFYSGHHGTDPDAMPPLRAAVPPEEDDHSRDLRGTQTTGADGGAQFRTIYPGWYWGRAIHVHVKVWVAGAEVYVGQFYLPEDTNALVQTCSPYAEHTAIERVPNAMDAVYQATGGPSVVLDVRAVSDDPRDGFVGAYDLVVATATAAEGL